MTTTEEMEAAPEAGTQTPPQEEGAGHRRRCGRGGRLGRWPRAGLDGSSLPPELATRGNHE
jgi:hypothetical protein